MNGYGELTEAVCDELRSVLGRGGLVCNDIDTLDNYAWDQAGRVWGHMPDALVRP